ncbi:hypothetical protein [Bartonella sp. F02]|uniref:hypothetical protein n=1 Tax=Bartonella sp. F02 TaxID=2967262 RepID=UPI0022A9336C|nr:hypothetical protein [Bartonella sp. F02]MCZ2328887.1 hypothetical protein [Bartonella sp. F02]
MADNKHVHSLQSSLEENSLLSSNDPLDPAVERIRKKLMRLMLISISITIALILAVLGGVIYKIIAHEPATKDTKLFSAPNTGSEITSHTLRLPEKTQILSHSLSEKNIMLHVLTPNGQTQFMIYNYYTGELISTLSVEITDSTPSPSSLLQTETP